MKKDMNWVVLGVALAVVAFLATGCSGMEVGGKLGVYRVDTRADRSETYHKPMPLKCYLWSDCTTGAVSNGGMVEGS